MKKKTRKRLIQTLTIAACVSQLAEFGMEVFKSVKQTGKKAGLLSGANGQLDHTADHKIIVPASV